MSILIPRAHRPSFCALSQARHSSMVCRAHCGTYLIAGLLWIALTDLTLAESGGLTALGFRGFCWQRSDLCPVVDGAGFLAVQS